MLVWFGVASACGSGEHAPFYASSGRAADRDADVAPQASTDGGDEARDGATSSASRVDGGTGSSPDEPTQPAGCDGGPQSRVLFIGNSHTYTNDLPSIVRELSCAAGTQVIVDSAAPGGVSFIEHAQDPSTLAAIEADAWDFVVLQDQQQHPGWRLTWVDEESVPAVQTLIDAIAAHRAETRPLFSMTWARIEGDLLNCDAYQTYPLACTFEGSTRAISEGYALYAERTSAELAPVALAWAAVRADADAPLPSSTLWAGDGYHPALPGSYLAASVLVGTMFGVVTASLGYDGGLEESVAAYLRSIADDIVSEHESDPRVTTTERVAMLCTGSTVCSDASDAASVTISLSSDGCGAIASGSANIRGRITTTVSCESDSCRTVPLGGWHGVPGGTIDDGVYQVHLHLDVNGNGEIDSGDGETCVSGQFEVGSGSDLTISELSAR